MINKDKLQQEREKTKTEILEKIKTCDRFAVVRPFGFGKTYTILELCKDFEGEKIIIEPNLEIIKNIKKNIPENTECITYHSLLHKDFNPKQLLEYDYIFLDEIHRTLAPKWGKVLRDVLKEFKGKVIGFTATPIRGDGRNPIDEIFNGEQISELSLVDAIVQEMLPNPTYITGIYELDNIILNNKQLRVQLKNYNLQNSLNSIFNKYLDFTKTLKIMVFSYMVDDISQAKKYIEQWFNVAIKHYEYHSYQSNDQNQLELQRFKNAVSGVNVMHSINQLNEGFHFENLDALIFLRKTDSDVVYLQQLGRGLSENINKIIVFDLMNNFLRNSHGYPKLLKEYAKKHNIDVNKIKTISNEDIKIYCEQQDLIDLLKEQSNKHIPLNEKEKEYILSHYKELSCNKMSKEINRSVNTIIRFLKQNNLPYVKTNFLTEKEKEYILDNYKNMSYTQIASNINRAKTNCICDFLKRKGLYNSNRLTETEKEFIQKNCKEKSITRMAKELNRDKKTIKNYIIKNNLKYTDYSLTQHLSEKEKNFIKNNYKNMSINVMKSFLKRDRETITRYLKQNNLKYNFQPQPKLLSEEEKQYIIQNHKKSSIKDIAKKLGRNPDTISKFIKKGIKEC